MKCTDLRHANLPRYAMSVAAGILWALSFPNAGLAGLAWIVPGMLLMSAFGGRGSCAFRSGYIAGATHYLISLYWLLLIPFPVGAVAGWLALSAYLALYPATWVWLCWRVFPFRTDAIDLAEARSRDQGSGVRGQESEVTPQNSPRALLGQFVATSLWQRGLWIVACAMAWVGLEMIVARLLTGFPWNLLGVSQYRILPVIQIASITGVYGVSFLVVWFSVALACAVMVLIARPMPTSLWLGDLLVPFLGVALVCWFGVKQIARPELPKQTVRMALIQPSIPQTLIWDPKENTNRFNQLLRLTRQALQAKPQVLVWPEAAVPNLLRYEPETIGAVRQLVTEHKVWMILGADDAVPKSPAATEQKVDYYNSSFLISPAGDIRATYRKRKLVIFGEYVPLARWLPFLKHLTPIGEGFKSGEEATPFLLSELNIEISVLVCFEDTFPHSVREYVDADTDFLLNLTNNGWFGESAAQWQHAANAAFRAVENGLPLVRCANNGLTCWVDSFGGLHDVYFPDSNDVYGAGFKIVEVPIPGGRQKREPTFYNRHGDWFGWGCVGLAAALLALSVFGSRITPVNSKRIRTVSK